MRRILISSIIGIVFLLLIPRAGYAQEFIEKITSFFEFSFGANRFSEDSILFVSRVVLAPVVNYEPATSVGLGVGAKILFKPGTAGLDTRTSNVPFSLTYTLKNQLIFYLGCVVFFDHERYLLKGNLEYSTFPYSYYGIGSQTTESDKLEISFHNFLFEPLLLKRVAPNLFVGGGFRYNINYNTKTLEDWNELPKGTSLQKMLGSTSSGLELAVTFDSRDNVLYPLYGNFLEFTHGLYGKSIGSTHTFMLSKLDFRQYFRLHPARLDMIAIQWYARMAWGGAPPLELSELGGYSLLRGFQEGRFRDNLALFAQAEYRWQALERLGVAFFGGVGEVGDEFQSFRLDKLKYSLGAGIRIKIIKSENLNIRLDYAHGLGSKSDQNFYLGIAEAF